jgi:flagellar assembly factor FliW
MKEVISVKVNTTRFGELEIEEEIVITFPRGIPGFLKLRRFFLVPVDDKGDIQWLQSLEDPDMALVIVDPFKYFRDYLFEIPDSELEELGIKEPSQALTVTVVTIPPDNPGSATANLVAPLIINTSLNKGKQIILSGSPYHTKHRLFPENVCAQIEKEAAASGEGV